MMGLVPEPHRREHQVLVVEDDMADWDLIQEAIKREKLPIQLHCLHHGDQVLNTLRQWRADKAQCFPDLILLDLNLPDHSGRQVLKDLRDDPAFVKLPVVLLSAYESPEEILFCYRLGCNCYIKKPDNWPALHRLMRSLFQYWFTLVELPTHSVGG